MLYFVLCGYMADFFSGIDELIKEIDSKGAIKLRIKVLASSKIDFIDFSGDIIKVKVRERAIEGRANKAVVEFLSETLQLSKSKIKILNGKTSAIKTIQITK